jgi:hypothetical protein
MSESTSYSMMGSVLKQSQDREGVRIDAPHGWVINDVHHAWTKNETYHWETGNIFHMTSGQVFHANLNLAEVHTTANVATMHLDITPLNVHMRPIPIGFDVHIEASHYRKHVNVHGGHHHQLLSNFHQESNAVHITSTTKAQTGWDKAADLLAHGPDVDHLGTITLEADGEMTLSSTPEMRLLSGPVKNPRASLELNGTDGEARLFSNKCTTVSSDTQTIVRGGLRSSVLLKTGSLELQSGKASVSLNGGKLTTNATGGSRINGKVSLGEPAIQEEYHGAADEEARVQAEREAAAIKYNLEFEQKYGSIG